MGIVIFRVKWNNRSVLVIFFEGSERYPPVKSGKQFVNAGPFMDYAPELYCIPDALNQLTDDKYFNRIDSPQPKLF